jgi:hypothetical protein
MGTQQDMMHVSQMRGGQKAWVSRETSTFLAVSL